MSDASAPPRERLQDRREAILRAARECFFTAGFEATSLDDIIARAGGSRRNIYAMFGDKEGLFEAVMRERVSGFLGTFEAILSDDMPPDIWLATLGKAFLEAILDEVTVKAFRQFIAVAGRRPDLAGELYKSGPALLHAKVARYLKAQTAAGRLAVETPDSAAKIFVEMVKSPFHFEALLLGKLPSEDAIKVHVAEAVAIFLDGVRQAPSAGAMSSRPSRR